MSRRAPPDGWSRRRLPGGAAHPEPVPVRRADRVAVRAAGLFRYRQPDLQREVVPAGAPGSAPPERARRRLHRRRPRSELLVHRRDPADGRLPDRRPPRQSAAAPPLQGAVRALPHADRLPRAAHRPSRPGRHRRLARRARRSSHRLHRRHRVAACLAEAGEAARQRVAQAHGRGDRAYRRAALGRGSRDDRSLPPAVHRRRPVAALRKHRPSASELQPDVSRSAARHRRVRTPGELPRVGRGVPVRQGPGGARPRDSGRRQPRRTVRGRRDRARAQRPVRNASPPSTSRTSSSTSLETAPSRGSPPTSAACRTCPTACSSGPSSAATPSVRRVRATPACPACRRSTSCCATTPPDASVNTSTFSGDVHGLEENLGRAGARRTLCASGARPEPARRRDRAVRRDRRRARGIAGARRAHGDLARRPARSIQPAARSDAHPHRPHHRCAGGRPRHETDLPGAEGLHAQRAGRAAVGLRS